MNPEKLIEYARLVSYKIYSLLESEYFFVMSPLSKSHPIGLIYADNGTHGAKLDKTTCLNFKPHYQHISNGLTQ